MNPDYLVELTNVDLTLNQREILKNINLTLLEGEILTIIGPNGAGKSSLIKILLKLLKPTAGQLSIKPGVRIGYMPQKLHIDRSFPVSVERFLRLSGNRSHTDLNTVLKQVRASHTLKAPLQSISGGEFQRVLLARALLRKPELLVLDEPAQGVDTHGQQEFYRLLAELRSVLGYSLIMVSHDLHFVMASTDKVICLNQHICCSGTADSVANHPEYRILFEQGAEKDFAMYTHKHDHHQGLHGEILDAAPSEPGKGERK